MGRVADLVTVREPRRLQANRKQDNPRRSTVPTFRQQRKGGWHPKVTNIRR